MILTWGTLNTPKLLQISGVGPPDGLRAIGVPVLHALGGVGDNLRDHYAARMVARIKNIRTINNMVQGAPLLLEIARWMLGRPSLLAVSPSLVHIFWKSNEALDRPDLEFACAPASFREGVVGLLAGATHEISLAYRGLTFDDVFSQRRGSRACRSRTWRSTSTRWRTRAAAARSSTACATSW